MCQVSFYFTSIIVYNCVFEFQTICHIFLPYHIYNLKSDLPINFANLYIIFQNDLPTDFTNLYIAILSLFYIVYLVYIYSLQYSLYRYLYSVLFLFIQLYSYICYIPIYVILYILIYYNCIISLFFFCLSPKDRMIYSLQYYIQNTLFFSFFLIAGLRSIYLYSVISFLFFSFVYCRTNCDIFSIQLYML